MTTNFIEKIGQIAIPVKDFSRGVQFYQEILELPLLFNTGNLAFFQCNGVRLLISENENDQFPDRSSVFYFQVQDIHAAFEGLKGKGVVFHDEPHLIAKMGNVETWMAFFHDTEGNIHALMSEFEV
jgi:predicted enzyme related to lactoylglutathione lyase